MIPRFNVWAYKATSAAPIDALVTELLDIFEQHREQLDSLVANEESSIGIGIMRSFNDPDGVDEDDGHPDVPDHLVKLTGQHQHLGFHLDTQLMARLVALGCSLDFDEYG